MVTEPYIETALSSALGLVVKNVSRVASDRKAATRERLKAIGLLLRIAMGPSNRPAEDVDVVASRDARNALFDAAPFLEEIVKKSRRLGWNASRAARLASRIRKIKRQSSMEASRVGRCEVGPFSAALVGRRARRPGPHRKRAELNLPHGLGRTSRARMHEGGLEGAGWRFGLRSLWPPNLVAVDNRKIGRDRVPAAAAAGADAIRAGNASAVMDAAPASMARRISAVVDIAFSLFGVRDAPARAQCRSVFLL